MNHKTRTTLWTLAAAILVLPAVCLAADKSMLGKVQSKMTKPAALALLHKALESEEKLMGKLDKIMSKDSTSKSETEHAWSAAISDHGDTWQGLVVKATKIQRGGVKKDEAMGTWPIGYSVWGNAQVKFLNEVADKKKGHMMIRFRRQCHALVVELKQRTDDDSAKVTDLKDQLKKIDEDVRKMRKELRTKYKTSREVATARMRQVNRAWNKTYVIQEFAAKRQTEIKDWLADKRNDPKTYEKYMTQIKAWQAAVKERAWVESFCKKSLDAWVLQCSGRLKWFKSKRTFYEGIARNFTGGKFVHSSNKTFHNAKWKELTEPVGTLLAEYLTYERELKAAGL
jgi:hypothetical protein